MSSLGGGTVTIPPDRLSLYERLLSWVERVEVKSNFGSADAAVNGNVHPMISKHGVGGIRLPEPDRSEFLAEFGADLLGGDPAWPPAREYVAVPDDLLADTDVPRPVLEHSLDDAQSLKPEATSQRTSPA